MASPTSLVDIYPTVLSLAGVDGPATRAVDLTTDRRDYAFAYYDISDHDWYRDPPDGVDRDRLPPPRQHAVWHSENNKVIYYPGEDKYVTIGDTDGSLAQRLDEHTAALEPVDTTIEAVDDDVSERLKDMGYLE